MRIGGLGSGMDTEGMLEQIMEAERQPLIRLQQQRQVLEWKQEDYREINSSMLSFRNNIRDMRYSSHLMQRTAESTNKGVATAQATTNAEDGNYQVEVHQLATQSHAQSNPQTQIGLDGNHNDVPLEELFEDELQDFFHRNFW